MMLIVPHSPTVAASVSVLPCNSHTVAQRSDPERRRCTSHPVHNRLFCALSKQLIILNMRIESLVNVFVRRLLLPFVWVLAGELSGRGDSLDRPLRLAEPQTGVQPAFVRDLVAQVGKVGSARIKAVGQVDGLRESDVRTAMAQTVTVDNESFEARKRRASSASHTD